MEKTIKTTQVKQFKTVFNTTSPIYQIRDDTIAIEKPIAIVYNGISHVVMMATPKDLENFAIGFSLTEQIIDSINDIYDIDVITKPEGVELQVEISSRRFIMLKEKRRNLTGRTGCGICGSEQLQQVIKPITPLENNDKINLNNFIDSLSALKSVQTVGVQTGGTHAAVWLDLQGQFIAGFEDIGRHVALDKLLGFRANYLKNREKRGVIIVSSRASYEMVQKCAICGIEILLAVSAPTSMAIDLANENNLTLVGFYRGEKGVIYTGDDRII